MVHKGKNPKTNKKLQKVKFSLKGKHSKVSKSFCLLAFSKSKKKPVEAKSYGTGPR